jgi:tagatose 1,6-diphosphate aldolase
MVMPSLSPGKARCLQRLSDGAGRYGLLAIDQRPPIFEIAAKAHNKPMNKVGKETVAIKRLLTEALAGQVSGLLVDPIYAYGAALPILPRECGLMLTLEHHVFKTRKDGHRLSSLIPRWSVDKAVAAGAEGLKLLAWHRPDAPREVRAHQERFVREAGAACKAAQRPFIFEILPYKLPSESEDEYHRKLPALSLGSAEAFADAKFGVDLYKLALPAAAFGVKEWGGSLYAMSEIRKTMDTFTKILPAPWLLLSGGLNADRFVAAMEAAADAGARGYLAGRAVWLDPLGAYPDIAKTRARLETEGRATLKRLNGVLARLPAAPPPVGSYHLPISVA